MVRLACLRSMLFFLLHTSFFPPVVHAPKLGHLFLSLGLSPKKILLPKISMFPNQPSFSKYAYAQQGPTKVIWRWFSPMDLSFDKRNKGNYPSHKGSLGVLQKVVFELQGEVVDLKFHIELLDHCISLLMAMKSYSNHSSSVKQHARKPTK